MKEKGTRYKAAFGSTILLKIISKATTKWPMYSLLGSGEERLLQDLLKH